MLSLPAFDLLYEHVHAFDVSTPTHHGPLVWSVSGSPVSLTTRNRRSRRVLTAFVRSGGSVDLVVTFRVVRGWFRNRVVADVEVNGQLGARGLENALKLRHSFDRFVLARLISDLERHANQLRPAGFAPWSVAQTGSR